MTRLRLFLRGWRRRLTFRRWADYLRRQDRAIGAIERAVLDVLLDEARVHDHALTDAEIAERAR